MHENNPTRSPAAAESPGRPGAAGRILLAWRPPDGRQLRGPGLFYAARRAATSGRPWPASGLGLSGPATLLGCAPRRDFGLTGPSSGPAGAALMAVARPPPPPGRTLAAAASGRSGVGSPDSERTCPTTTLAIALAFADRGDRRPPGRGDRLPRPAPPAGHRSGGLSGRADLGPRLRHRPRRALVPVRSGGGRPHAGLRLRGHRQR